MKYAHLVRLEQRATHMHRLTCHKVPKKSRSNPSSLAILLRLSRKPGKDGPKWLRVLDGDL